jgi:hypothetical protein
MDSHNTLIADDLLENIYQSLSELGDIKLIITQMYNFFKENDYSNNEIRDSFANFFHERLLYFQMTYNTTYRRIGLIVEKLIYDNENPNQLLAADTEISTQPIQTPEVDTLESSNDLNNILVENEDEVEESSPEDNTDNIEANTSTTEPDDISPSTEEQDLANNVLLTNIFGNLFRTMGMNHNHLQPVVYLPQEVNDLMNTYNDQLAHPILNLLNMQFQPIVEFQQLHQPMVDVKNIMKKEELDKLKIENYTDLDKEKYKNCSICMDEYNDEDKLRMLKCEHGFHVECIDKWLTECNYKCPVCRDDSNEHHAEV